MYIQISDLRADGTGHPHYTDKWQPIAEGEVVSRIASNDASDGLGQDAATLTVATPPATPPSTMTSIGETVIGLAALASGGIGFYHGYLRNNDSFGWGLWWAFMGTIFPVIVPAYAFAQGLGKPAKE